MELLWCEHFHTHFAFKLYVCTCDKHSKAYHYYIESDVHWIQIHVIKKQVGARASCSSMHTVCVLPMWPPNVYIYSPTLHPPPSCSPGLSPESGADVVGEPDHGHLRLAGPGHRAAHRVPAPEEALRPQQPPDLQDHAEEHPGTQRLPAGHHLHPAVCRWVVWRLAEGWRRWWM